MNLEFGSFSGDPIIRLLCDGRNVQVMERFTFTDKRGVVWATEVGDISDGASIPRLLWPIVGGPFEGLHRGPALLHDRVCRNHKTNAERRAGDWMLYEACLCAGSSEDHARRIYLGVSVGSLQDAIGDRIHVDQAFARIAIAPDPPYGGGH